MSQARIEPQSVVVAVESYVTSELTDTARFDNRKPLDDSGVWSLHALAASIYALGWEDAERAVLERERHRRNRDRETAMPTDPTATAAPRCPATRTLSFGCGFTCGLTPGHGGKHIDPATATGWADEDFEPAEGRHV